MQDKQILVVEDEEDILELVSFNLKKQGYQVKGVTSGEEALQEARRKIPSLIILDLMLPGVDGFDVCKSLKNDPTTKAVPIVMLTARSEEADCGQDQHGGQEPGREAVGQVLDGGACALSVLHEVYDSGEGGIGPELFRCDFKSA